MKKFSSEKELQSYCAEVLKQKGLSPQREVQCGRSFRADIVAGDTVYEIKLVLSYNNLYKALGQAQTYSRLLRKRHIHLVGYAPMGKAEAAKAKRLAAQLRATGVKVSFIGEETFWKLSHKEAIGWRLYRSGIALVTGVLLLSYVAWMMQGVLDPRECTLGIGSFTCINDDGSESRYTIW